MAKVICIFQNIWGPPTTFSRDVKVYMKVNTQWILEFFMTTDKKKHHKETADCSLLSAEFEGFYKVQWKLFI